MRRYAEKQRELPEAKKDWVDVKKAKLAYKRMWFRRFREQEVARGRGRSRKAREAREAVAARCL